MPLLIVVLIVLGVLICLSIAAALIRVGSAVRRGLPAVGAALLLALAGCSSGSLHPAQPESSSRPKPSPQPAWPIDRAGRDAVEQAIWQTVGAGGSLAHAVLTTPAGRMVLIDEFKLPCTRGYDSARVDGSLRDLQQAARGVDRDFAVLIAPDKSAVLAGAFGPATLGPAGPGLLTCAASAQRADESLWAGKPKAPVVTLWAAETAAERADPGRVYAPGGSHWTTEGGLLFSRALLDKLVIDGQAPAQLHGAPVAVRGPDLHPAADLYDLLGKPRSEAMPNWLVHRSDVRTRLGSTTPTPSGRGIRVFRNTAVAGRAAALVPGRTLVVQDSFWYPIESQLTPYFAELSIMHWLDLPWAATHGALIGYDRILLETSQRNWPDRSAQLLPGHQVHDALAQALGGG